ncbi:MAG: hypothetical protein EA406_07840 [Rhodospirillales bacterium]|nr:MAG: hypothetical protein EA406_07840 [Rhodospirillales bacterium]
MAEDRALRHLDRWVIGAFVTVIGLFGLYLASRADEQVMYMTGLILFIGSILFNFVQINQVYSHKKK